METYWQIGQDIVAFEQGGKLRADYGKALINNLERSFYEKQTILEKWNVGELIRQKKYRPFSTIGIEQKQRRNFAIIITRVNNCKAK